MCFTFVVCAMLLLIAVLKPFSKPGYILMECSEAYICNAVWWL